MKKNGLLRAARISMLAGAVVTASLFAANAANAAIPNKTLVYCSEGSPSGFDPAQYTTGVDFTANTFTVYNRLVEFERGGTKVEPGLAEKWDVSADGLTYTFHLRHGVKFQTTSFFKPTREFNADDVLFTFNRMLDPNQPFRKAYPVAFPYFTDMGLDKLITKIEKVDPYTVKFTLKEVNAPFIQNLAMEYASILSAEYGDKLLKDNKAADINQFPVGTGPFIFRSYTKDATIRFDGNPDYWKPNDVKLSKLIFSITPDAAVRVQKLKNNECQVMSYPRPGDIATLKASPNIDTPSQAGFNEGYVAYNVTKKNLDNVDVRRALDMAINKKAIIESVYQGAGQAAVAPMPPTQWSYDKSLKGNPYDTAKAKELLTKAGFPNGFELTLWAMPVQRPYNPNARLMAEMIQADWAKIGVKATIVSYEWGEYLKRAHAGEHDAMLIGWTGDNGDPDNWLGTLLGCDAVKGSNFSKFCYKPFEEQVSKGRVTNDIAQRTKAYTQAQQIFAQQLPFSPIAHSTVYQPASKKVIDIKIEPLGYLRFDGVGMQ
ncbi:Dipeptide-binding ABC transporter, periplasmic substrate-binding component (TC 3.A.1.5.2) [Caballeronia glathei]|jgi:dipeptide transport system substrate-binding protein|uniref:ABC transporter substrate-binding protein n=1 Tax=Caballeronia glathei TaxID=60547 RepID=UPI000501603F|nr:MULTISPECIES: ABC transporter substrate-binding protein [Burkholderiaceae]TCK42001.1 dipeptide transport system substrate-binding protein [Paraburkholderia sp. BL8N3]CDY73554.1 Dipeptide-binding ABC transporter, periplasmic substrate-binding component (TC 3.A.1.5.2) [Caballeronia glathei]